jgi:hypothetical protein
MVTTRSTRRRPEPFTVRDVAQGLRAIAYWNGILADLMSQPEVRLCRLGNIGDFSKGNVGGWPPIAEQASCRVRAPIPSGIFALGEAGEVLYVLRDCTASIASIIGRLPRGMDLTAPLKPGPRGGKRPTAAKRARTSRTPASKRPAAGKRAGKGAAPKRPAARKRAAPKRVKRSK